VVRSGVVVVRATCVLRGKTLTSRRRLQLFGRAAQQLADLLVAHLQKILVGVSYRQKRLGCMETNHLIYLAPELGTGLSGGNWNRYDKLLDLLRTKSSYSGSHGGTGGQSIVSEDDGLSPYISGRPRPAVGTLAPVQLVLFVRGDCRDLAFRYVEGTHYVVADYANATRSNRPHGQLLLSRHTQLPYQHEIQWGLQCPGNFVRYRNSAARQGQHEKVSGARMVT
jgi:hypothetical protein